MYSTYIRGSGKITSTYIPTNPNGSIDYSNIRTYHFSATNKVVTDLRKTTPVNKGAVKEYYNPQSFPTGTWNVEKSIPVAADDPEKQAKGNVFIPTNATLTVDTYGTTKPDTGAQPTGTQVDGGYGLHFSEYNTTLGCIKIGSQEQANLFATLSDQALPGFLVGWNTDKGRSLVFFK